MTNSEKTKMSTIAMNSPAVSSISTMSNSMRLQKFDQQKQPQREQKVPCGVCNECGKTLVAPLMTVKKFQNVYIFCSMSCYAIYVANS